MEFFLTLIILVLVFGALVFVHELGHFLAAKRAGVLVEQFAFGFGPKILGKKYKETEYRINLFPLGGYVKMVGDQDSTSMLRYKEKPFLKNDRLFIEKTFATANIDITKDAFEDVEQFVKDKCKELDKRDSALLKNYFNFQYIPNHPGNYENISMKAKFLIMIGGVTMNILLAIVMFYGLLITNEYKAYFPYFIEPATVGGKVVNSFPYLSYLADESKKDLEDSLILELDGQYFPNEFELESYLSKNEGKVSQVKLFSFDESKVVDAEMILSGVGVASNLDKDMATGVFITGVTDGGIADMAGIKEGDTLLTINSEILKDIDKLLELRDKYRGQEVTATLMSAEQKESEVVFTFPDEEKPIIGIQMAGYAPFLDDMIFYYDYSDDKLLSGIYHAINIGIFNTQGILSKFTESFENKSLEPISESVGGIVAVTDITYSLVSAKDFRSIIDMTAMLNVILAIMNILPIPLLDGGHIIFLIIEKLRGRPISEKKQEKISIVAFWGFIIFTVLVFAKDLIFFDWPERIYNLIMRLFV